ncbi:MAG: sugar ABC transporter substrate-binding protein, partial [Acetatifactor sp.]|nr:sugar ABC transporter substrate-binding protein [Acetatifactor sp.]
MKKKLLSVLLSTAMLMAVLTGCGKNDAPTTSTAPDTTTTDKTPESNAGSGEAVTLKWAIWDEATTQYWGDIK